MCKYQWRAVQHKSGIKISTENGYNIMLDFFMKHYVTALLTNSIKVHKCCIYLFINIKLCTKLLLKVCKHDVSCIENRLQNHYFFT